MESDWTQAKLGDYIVSFLGKMLDKNKNTGEYHPYLGNSNVRWGEFELDDLAEMKFETHEHTRYGLKKGDLIICEGGEPGRCAIWEDEIPNMKIQKALHRVRTLPGLDSEYLYYWFLFSTRAGHIEPFFTGTTIKHLTGKALKEIPIIIPPLTYQQYSAKLLRRIDKKISLNRQINQTLEQMAQALFKSWFVDFDPVVDNALDAGFFEKNLDLPDQLLRRAASRRMVRESRDFKPLPDDILQLFPDSFEECSEPTLGLGGWAPEGWSQGCISDVARYRAERVNTAELTLDNYISTENMLVERKGVQPATSLPTVNSVPAYTSGTVLVSNIRPYFKKIWLAQGDGGYSNDVLGFEAKVSGTECYLFNLMCQDTFFDFMMATSKGSKMPRGDKKAILGWGLVVPPLSLRLFFSEKLNDFYTSANSRHHENITLSRLRDTLLSKLISGELRLSEVEIAETELA